MFSREFQGCVRHGTGMLGTGVMLHLLYPSVRYVVPNLPKCPLPVLMLSRTYVSVLYRYESMYRYRRYRCPDRTELTEVSGTGVDVIPNTS